jgi:hypothetical protein
VDCELPKRKLEGAIAAVFEHLKNLITIEIDEPDLGREILSNVVDEIFFGLSSGAASRAVPIFSSAVPPKPVLSGAEWARFGRAATHDPSVHLAPAGGDEIRTTSQKATPYLFCLSMSGRR